MFYQKSKGVLSWAFCPNGFVSYTHGLPNPQFTYSFSLMTDQVISTLAIEVHRRQRTKEVGSS
jgi:hypothetical protein